MARLEELTKGAAVRGVLGDRAVTVVDAAWQGSNALVLTFADPATGKPGQELLFRDDEPRLSIDQAGRAWSFDADPHLFQLASEATRISLAHLFDPFLAVQTSNLEPLPHQVDAVYREMLPRRPLRYLLADDPGAGKTIMAGLYCKELMVRGDVERCLIVAPGSLVEQWREELWQRFGLSFEILTRDMIEAARTGNPFSERPLLIARLDHLSRREDLQDKLAATDWDLVVVDEAHKMSAHYVGSEVKETKRYRLGRLLGSVTRHLLLMTATPHAGIPEDFQLFLALLDGDRFVGKPRSNGRVDVHDMMRRLVKERLLRFDGTLLFPERRAYSPTYPLSDGEARLYQRVTEYVQDEMNRAERLKQEGQGRRGAVVGFALTTLQRRLASSPEAIYRSLSRRRGRLEARLAEERQRLRGQSVEARLSVALPEAARDLDDDFDPDDLPEGELEELEDEVVDEASAARTIVELEHEIATLTVLEELARQVRASGTDRKWEELAGLLDNEEAMFDPAGERRKLIVFTEHKDTLTYLVERLGRRLGEEAVVAIHGSLAREHRREVQASFTTDKDVLVLVATDAAGEGINLQRAHLMVNYDLPWNPNRIEQRFGRIHRIGQTEVCHLWNLVAQDTREGQVFHRLFAKLEEQRQALGDQVFDVLGESFTNTSLRDLLIDAIRYGDDPLRRSRRNAVVDSTVGDALTELVHERALVSDVLTGADVLRIRDDMDRAEARKLQPHFIRSFFVEAFTHLGGTVRDREAGRSEITHVPAELRRADHVGPRATPVMRRYERVTFDKELVTVEGRPLAELLAPGHPLLDATVDVVVERYGPLLRQGTVLVDEQDPGTTPRVLVYLRHQVVDGRLTASGERQVVSEQFGFAELTPDGRAEAAGWAPYLEYRELTDEEQPLVAPLLGEPWLRDDLATRALEPAVEAARRHVDEVRRRTLDLVDRTTVAVKDRLLSEISHWDHRANDLKALELAGKQPRSGMNSGKARQRADELEARLKRRLADLDAQRQLAPLPPVVVGGALVVPAGLLATLQGTSEAQVAEQARETTATERAAVDAVLAAERALGRQPTEMPHNHKGYDIESRSADGALRFIEVKGRVAGADTFTITRSEIGVGRNTPDQHVLALVEVSEAAPPEVRYLRGAFEDVGELPFDTISVNLLWRKYFGRAGAPA